MNSDNPYAAPQTLDGNVSSADVPLAVDSERRLYDDVSTERLLRLAHWSLAIHAMSLTWGVVLVVAVLMFLTMPFMFAPVAVTLLAALRVWGGFRRTPWFWSYDLIVDSICFGGLVYWLYSLFQADFVESKLVGALAFLFAVMAGLSVLAHLVANSLYIHFTHQELIAEVHYRKQNCIA